MATRNAPLGEQIIAVLEDLLTHPLQAQQILEAHFKDSYILNAGDVTNVAAFAEDLRLSITSEECSQVLDYIAQQATVGITINDVETAVYEIFGNRFIEPNST